MIRACNGRRHAEQWRSDRAVRPGTAADAATVLLLFLAIIVSTACAEECTVHDDTNIHDRLPLPFTYSTIMAAPTISAAQAVGEYLQSPDDLAKVVAFRKKLEKEKASIDARLRSGVKEQLDATRDGLRKLFGTRNNVQSIKDEMETVDKMCSDPTHVVSTFDQISRVRFHVRLQCSNPLSICAYT